MLTTASDGAASADNAGKAVLRLAPLGLPLRVELRGIGNPDAVGGACLGWTGEPAASAAALVLTLALDPALAGAGATAIEVEGRRLALRGPGLAGGACADRGRAWCAASGAWLQNPERLRAEVLDPLVLFLVARRGRTPLHAAAIERGGLAILLAGPSGAGKSSLALAADRAGWTVLTEDTAYVQSEPGFAVWGWPGPAHVLPADNPSAAQRVRWRNGRLKHAVPLNGQPAGALVAERATLCLLAPGRAVALERLSPAAALGALPPPEPGFDLLARDIARASALLVRGGAWRLTLSTDPAEAIALLAAHLPRLRETACGGGHRD